MTHFFTNLYSVLLQKVYIVPKLNTEMEKEEHRHCLECGQEFYGRPDKRFCNESCRNKFNNRRNSEGRKRRTRVIGILTNNYAILEKLIETGRTSFTMEELIGTGYNLQYVTGQRKTPQSRDERRCFDIVYFQTPNRIFNVHRLSF